jgi:hypothetical protein
LGSRNFFNSKIPSITAGAGAVRVLSASPNTAVGDRSIIVEQLASASTLTSQKAVGNNNQITAIGEMTDTMLRREFDKVLALRVGNYEDDFKLVHVDLNGVTTQAEAVKRINDEFQSKNVLAKAELAADGRLELISERGVDFIDILHVSDAHSTRAALNMLGLRENQISTSYSLGGQRLVGVSPINPNVGVNFTVNVDGVAKQITINAKTAEGKAVDVNDSPNRVTRATVMESLQIGAGQGLRRGPQG